LAASFLVFFRWVGSLACPEPRRAQHQPPLLHPSFASFASRMFLRDRTKQADVFFRFRSCDRRFRSGRKCVGLRREKSLCSLSLCSGDFMSPICFSIRTSFSPLVYPERSRRATRRRAGAPSLRGMHLCPIPRL
jgi:hypothetical protein